MMKYCSRLCAALAFTTVLLAPTASAQTGAVWQSLNKKYDIVIPAPLEGMIVVGKGMRNTPDAKYGYVDTLGQEVIPLIYNDLNDFSNGYAVVGSLDAGNMRYGLIDRTGKMVVPCTWCHIEDLSDGIAVAFKQVQSQRQYFTIDTMWRVTPLSYDYCRGFSNGYAIVGQGAFKQETPAPTPGVTMREVIYFVGKHGYITPDGKLAIGLQYDDARDFDAEGLAAVAINGKYYPKWGIINKKGETVVPCNYYGISDFSRDKAVVCKVVAGGKLTYGYLDRNGTEVIPCQFDMATSFRFKNTWVGVEMDGEMKYRLIDLNGKTVSGSVLELDDSGRFGHATAAIRDAQGLLHYGIVDNNGRILLPFEYDHISLFSELDPLTGRWNSAATATKDGIPYSFDITTRDQME